MMRILIDEATGNHYYMCGDRKCKVWTPRELSEFKLWYPTTPNSELSKIFQCSVAVIQKKALVMGLRKNPEWLKRRKRELVAHCSYVARDKIIANNKSEKKRKQLSERFRGRKRDKEFGEAISRGLKRWYHNPANKQYMEDAHRRAMENDPEFYKASYKRRVAIMNQARELKRAQGL